MSPVGSEPALGLIEFNSIAQGIHASDEMIKKAPIRMIESRTVCPGKYIALIVGDEASVEDSVRIGLEVGGHSVVDQLFLPNLHPQVTPAITGTTEISGIIALGVIETFSVAGAVLSADTAVKAAGIRLIEIRLANGLGGKSFFTLTGELPDVLAAVEAGTGIIREEGLLVNQVVLPKPHGELTKFLV